MASPPGADGYPLKLEPRYRTFLCLWDTALSLVLLPVPLSGERFCDSPSWVVDHDAKCDGAVHGAADPVECR